MLRLFLYGTLMTGEPSHRVLREAAEAAGETCRLLGPARTEPRYRLVDLTGLVGPFPALLDEVETPWAEVGPASTAVAGELWQLGPGTREHLDRFEGHPGLYERKPVELEELALLAGETPAPPAEAYFLADRVRWRLERQLENALPEIPGGDWRRFRPAPRTPPESSGT